MLSLNAVADAAPTKEFTANGNELNLPTSGENWNHIADASKYSSILYATNGGKLSVTGDSIDLIIHSINKDPTDKYTRSAILADSTGRVIIGNDSRPLKSFNIDVSTDLQTGSEKGHQIAMGIFAQATAVGQKGGHVDINSDEVNIKVTSPKYFAYGIYAVNRSTDKNNIAIADRTSVNIKAKKTVIDVAAPEGQSNGIIAWSQGRVTIAGSLAIRTWNSDRTVLGVGNVLNARGDVDVRLNESADPNATVQLDGNINFEYNGKDSGTMVDSTVVINLTNANSYWKGNIQSSYTGFTEGQESYLQVSKVSLGLSNGAQWTPTAVDDFHQSEKKGEQTFAGQHQIDLNHLKLNEGIINITGNDVKLNVENLYGQGGTVRLATNLKAGEGQQTGEFTVEKAESNSAIDVQLMDSKLEKALTSDEINAEQAKSLITAVNGAVKPTTTVVEGMYNEGFKVDTSGNTTITGPNTLMQSTLELASATPLALNRILTTDVRKRLGDIRSVKGISSSWARYDGGKLSGTNGLENDFNTVQVGVDTQPSATPLRFGMAFSYTKGDADYARGSADMDAYSLAGYGLWLGESGQYVDVVTRLASIKTDITVDGSKKGSMDNVALSLSTELGWRFDVMNNLFVEPQVEATYTYVNAESMTLNEGSNYRFEAADSLLGRAGLIIGMQCPNNKGNVYGKLSAVHEFLGDASVTGGNGAVYSIDGKDTWIEYGIGANLNLTDSTYLWADLERTSGGVLDMDYRATLGVRYVF